MERETLRERRSRMLGLDGDGVRGDGGSGWVECN